jgi:hypothetical protein
MHPPAKTPALPVASAIARSHQLYNSGVKDTVQCTARPSPIGLIHLPLPYLTTLVGFLISLLIGSIGLIGSEQGVFFRLTNRISGEPVWAPEIAAGLLFGWLAYKRVPSRLAFASCAVPAVILLWNVTSWQRTMSQYDSTWGTFFGTECGGSECLYQLFLTAPFYTAVAYSAGAVIAHVRGQRRKAVSSS